MLANGNNPGDMTAMNPEVTCAFVYDKSEFNKANAPFAFRTTLVLLLAFSLLNLGTFAPGAPLRSTLFTNLLLFLAVSTLIRRIRIARFNASSTAGRVWTVKISETEVKFWTDVFEATCLWDMFPSARIDRSGIRLFPHPLVMYWIPTSGFTSAVNFEAACQLVKTKVKKVKDTR